jgi:hypothetical protein
MSAGESPFYQSSPSTPNTTPPAPLHSRKLSRTYLGSRRRSSLPALPPEMTAAAEPSSFATATIWGGQSRRP